MFLNAILGHGYVLDFFNNISAINISGAQLNHNYDHNKITMLNHANYSL